MRSIPAPAAPSRFSSRLSSSRRPRLFTRRLRPRPSRSSAGSETSSKIWLDREKEFEEYMKAAEIVKVEILSVGVTKPKRADLAPGGPVNALAWKRSSRGDTTGVLGKLQVRDRRLRAGQALGAEHGAADCREALQGRARRRGHVGVSGQELQGLGGAPTPRRRCISRLEPPVVRAKMFDNLIDNIDPNLGNWLVDPAWNLILIDHTRSFTKRHQDGARDDARGRRSCGRRCRR